MLRVTTLAGAVAVAMLPALASAQEEDVYDGWTFTVGAGTLYAPTYLGDDDYQAMAFPNLMIEYEDRFFASLGTGIGYNVINDDGWRIGPVAKYDFGRDEDGSDPLSFAGDDTTDLVGLGNVDGTVELGAFAEYTYEAFTGSVQIRQGLGGHEGLIGELGVAYGGGFAVGELPGFFSIGPQFVFASDDYNSAYFDVNASQSARSGLAIYDADGGLVSYGIHGTAGLMLTDNVSLIGFAGLDRLGNEIADSSLVETRGSETQATAGIMLNYTF